MPKLLWSQLLSAPSAGIALARETGGVLAWDVQNQATITHRNGAVVAEARLPEPIHCAAIANDASAIVVADEHSLAWLNRELKELWRKPLSAKPTSIAVEGLGQFVAIADAANTIHFFDSAGRHFGSPVSVPRALYYLRLPPETQTLFAAADFGLITAIDLSRREVLWQDNPVTHLGDLDAAAGGAVVAAACFSEGIRRLDRMRKPLPAIPMPEPCRYVSMSYSGARFLTGSIVGGIAGFDDRGGQRFEQRFEQMLTGVQLSPLADVAVIALSDGRVLGLDVAAELK